MEGIEIRQPRPLVIRHQDWHRTGEYKVWIKQNRPDLGWSPKVQLNLTAHRLYNAGIHKYTPTISVMLPRFYIAMSMK